MHIRKLKGAQLLLAAIVATMVVLPIAFANASSGGSATKSAIKQVKLLTKRVSALESALNGRIAALEAKKTPTTLPPSGPAGGSLAGTYPNPLIGPGKVDTTQIAPAAVDATKIATGAVDGSKILDDTIGPADLGAASIGGSALKNTFTFEPEAGVKVEAGQTKVAKATCPGGTRAIAGGNEWGSAGGNGTAVISSGPTSTGNSNTTWEVQGRVDTGGTTNTLFADVVCLPL